MARLECRPGNKSFHFPPARLLPLASQAEFALSYGWRFIQNKDLPRVCGSPNIPCREKELAFVRIGGMPQKFRCTSLPDGKAAQTHFPHSPFNIERHGQTLNKKSFQPINATAHDHHDADGGSRWHQGDQAKFETSAQPQKTRRRQTPPDQGQTGKTCARLGAQLDYRHSRGHRRPPAFSTVQASRRYAGRTPATARATAWLFAGCRENRGEQSNEQTRHPRALHGALSRARQTG